MSEELNVSNIFIYLVYTILLSTPIFIAVVRKFKAKRVGKLYHETVFYFSLVAAVILKVSSDNNFVNKICDYLNIKEKLQEIMSFHDVFQTFIMGFVEIFIGFLCFYVVLNIIGILILLPAMKLMEEKFPSLGKVIDLGIGTFKGIFYIVILTIIIRFFSLPFQNNLMYKTVDSLLVNPIFQSNITQNIATGLENSLKIKIDSSVGVTNREPTLICNGVTLTEALKSSKVIEDYASKLIKNIKTDRGKAKALYNYVGKEITYDDEKAKRISKEDYSIKSGAINTFNTKKGVCFDYACLYVVMADSIGIKSRIVTGQGYSGKEWISHAWVEVYLKDEDKWISIDPTFARAENYFDNRDFNKDHKKEKVIWESSK